MVPIANMNVYLVLIIVDCISFQGKATKGATGDRTITARIKMDSKWLISICLYHWTNVIMYMLEYIGLV